MSSQMYRPPSIYLLIFCCFTFVCIHGGGQDCNVELMVKRGTTMKVVPQQHLQVACPVNLCGESQNVIWCKILEANRCEEINSTENVEITQNDEHDENKQTSFLNFKRISIHDDGMYRCHIKGNTLVHSHSINISVSELHQEVESSDNNTDELPSVVDNLSRTAGDEDLSWLPYFSICISIALLILTLTVITLLSVNGWKRTLTFCDTNGQEMSTHVIPGLPKMNPPSTPVLQYHFTTENCIYSQSTAEKPSSTPMTDGSQPALPNTANAVYAVINHSQSRMPTSEQHPAPKQDKKAEYAVINVA